MKRRDFLSLSVAAPLLPATTAWGIAQEPPEGDKAGWTDPEVFEASFIASLFALFNRMADAYGLDYAPNGWMPTELRGALPRV